MNKPYSGNGKPFVLALFAEQDKEKVLPVLEALEKKELILCGQDGKATEVQARKACTTVAFLSEYFAKDEGKQRALFAADAAGLPVIPVKMDDAKQPEVLERSIMAKNAILAQRYSVEELADRIAGAESLNPPKLTPAQTGGTRLRNTLILTAALIAFIGAVWAVNSRTQFLDELYRKLFPTPTPTATATPEPETPSPSPAPTPTPTPEPILTAELIEKYGITDEDLKTITNVTVIGKNVYFYKTGEELAYSTDTLDDLMVRSYEPGDVHYYLKEDGSEVERGFYDDLWFLVHMPRLRYLNVAAADFENLPDLAKSKLNSVVIVGCTIPDLNWLAGAGIRSVRMKDVQDGLALAPLTECAFLNNLSIEFGDTTRADMTGLSPKNLINLWLTGGAFLNRINLDSLSACNSLNDVRLDHLPITNLNFLNKKYGLDRLEVWNSDTLGDISALVTLRQLKELNLGGCRQISDFSVLADNTDLERFHFNQAGGNNLNDASFLENKKNLNSVQLYGCRIQNLDFLKSIRSTRNVELTVHGEVRDWSALEAVESYSRLCLNVDPESYETILSYLEGKNIDTLQLEWMDSLDLSKIPQGTKELQISGGNLTDLSGLPKLNLRKLYLYDMQELTSLNGIEALKDNPIFRYLEVTGCPRLTDWSALNGMGISELSLIGTYTMPDLGAFKPTTLRLDSLTWLEDLSCLDALDESRYYNLDLLGLDLVTDLSPVKRLKGSDLRVSPLLKEQAESLVEEKRFQRVEIVYPDSWWNVWKGDVQLKSLEELDTLPLAAVKRVTNLELIGDRVVDRDRQDLWERWDDEGRYYILYDRETDEETRVETGTLTDLSRLSLMTGMTSLTIVNQSLTSLEGIDGMTELEELRLQDCRQLEDISPVFALELIRLLELTDVPASSIQGIQNLPKLQELRLTNTHVTDISPLAGCDLTEAYRNSGLTLDIKNSDEYMIADCTPLESIEKFDYVPLNEGDAYDWLPHMQNAEVNNLYIAQINNTQDLTLLGSMKAKSIRLDSFDQLTSLHGLEEMIDSGTLETLEILGCPRLTDWSALESGYLPKLWLYTTFDIPDMSRMDIGTLRLEQLNWLKDLKQLETIGQEREINIELADLANLEDLSSLKKIRGNRLAVTEDLLKQARDIVAGGSFRSAEIADGDGWGASNDRFTLVSLEELETLPESVLSHVTEMFLVGDQMIDRNRYWTEWNWQYDEPRRELWDGETGEVTMPDYGKMPDLTFLSKLTGLKILEIDMSGIASLAGIENMPDLEQLHIRCAPNLTDVSAAWGLKNLQSIEFNQTAVDSIDGMENLKMLKDFSVYGPGLRDISALRKCDFSYAYQNGGLNIDLFIDPEADMTPVEGIRHIRDLNLNNEQIGQWLPHIRNAEVDNLTLQNWSGEISLADLPRVTSWLGLHSLPGLKDLTGLNSTGLNGIQLDNLQGLTSLNGIQDLLKNGMEYLDIGNCPRLTDWSALDDAKPAKLRIYGNLVFLTDNLKEIAEPVNQEIDPGEWWDENASFTLTSLEEIDELPEEILGSIERLWLAGNGIYDRDSYDTWWYEENGEQVVQLNRYDSDEFHVEHMGNMTDLTGLSKLTGLKELYLDLQGLTSLDGLENLTNLEVLSIRKAPNLKDISAIGNLTNLKQLQLNNDERLENLDIIRSMKNLESIRIYDDVMDVSALAECDFSHAYENGGLNMYLAIDGEADMTPLESIREFSGLQLDWDRPARYSPYLQNAVIHVLEVNGTEDLNLAILPAVTDRLSLHNLPNITDLTGLKGPGPHMLQLDDLPDLKSLDGIRELIGEGGIRELWIGGCPRIADWSALEGTDLEKIVVYGDLVYVPDSLRDKVERTDGDGYWWTNDGDIQFSVSSLEELESLPDELKSRVSSLMIIGDQVWDTNRYELHSQWDENKKKEIPMVYDRETGEETPAETGTMTDLSRLKGMTGLTWLCISGQPLESLNGLEDLTRLQEVQITHCDLEDYSEVFALPEIEFIHLDYTAVSSLAGIGTNGKLHGLWLSGVGLTDLSPLVECDFEYASEHGGFIFDYDNENAKDFSFLSRVSYFCDLCMSGIDASRWVEEVSNSRIQRVVAFRFPSQKVFAAFAEAHQDIEVLHIPWNDKVTDLSMTLEMPNLQRVQISNNMKKAINSLKGKEYPFELVIE